MANILAPFGFRAYAMLNGATPNFAPRVRMIASANATAIYRGDPVVQLSTGYIAQATAGTTQIAGIMDGCTYLSKSFGRRVWMPYWPGNGDANGDIEAYIIDPPNIAFVAQSSNGGPVVIADVGMNINFALGTGNTSTGLSGAYADFATIATTSTLPFRIIGYGGGVGSPVAVGNGSDPATEYNYVYLAFNNQDFKSLTGI